MKVFIMKNITLIVLVLLLLDSCNQTVKDSSPLLTYTTSGRQEQLVKTGAEWQDKRAQILEGMEDAMGQLPDWKDLPAFGLQVMDTLFEDRFTRYAIAITVAKDERLPAYLYLPAGMRKNEKRPAMLVLHETGDPGKELVHYVKGFENRALARELAERGYVVIAPDYPSMGELMDYDFENDRYVSGTMKGVFNHMRCVDFLQSRSEVDPDRIGVIGHSLGGHNAMFVGAFDTRLKVVVSSCGWTLMNFYDIGEVASKRYGGRLGPWAQDRYMPLLREKYELDPDRIPFDFDLIIASLAPRAFFSNSPVNDSNFAVDGVREGIASALEVYSFLNAEDKIQVRYPEAAHDFPPEVRSEAYCFIDKILEYSPAIEGVD